mmetsp:Transcript_39330/g.60109  ORF Transcript_39330/g.60109 Transcript_39330/m.60109 type:complete len:113 (+) Transcript_39330:2440-2778(+)
MVKVDQARFDNQQSLKQTAADKNALDKLNKIIINAQRKYTELKTDQMRVRSSVVKIQKLPSLYRLISMRSIKDISGAEDPLEVKGIPQKRQDKNTEEFYSEFFSPCKILAAG